MTKENEAAPDEEVLQQFEFQGIRYAVCAKTGSLGDPWFNYASYVDLMNKPTVERFLEITLEAYRGAVGEEFGATVPGVFTDEPCFLFFGFRGGFLPWTPALPAFFHERHGYELTSSLASLFLPIDDYARVRYDFFDAATRLFKESFTETYEAYSKRHGLIFTGHFMSEDNLERQTQWIGAAMPHYEHMTWPGIDKLERHVDEHITCKQVSSVADQLEKERTFCETFGGGGQHLSFADRRWIYNWEAALGINVANPHLALYTMSGERKRDFPANLFYQQPWWELEEGVNDYFGRVSYALSRGRRMVDILVLHPIGSAWALYDVLAYGEDRESPIKPYDRHLEDLTRRLLEHQLDFHFGDEMIMERHASVAEDGRLRVGALSYSTVVVPASVTWRGSTVDLLRSFAEAGGRVILTTPLPRFQDMRVEIDLTSQLPGCVVAETVDQAVAAVSAASPAPVALRRTDLGTHPAGLRIHRRLLPDNSELIFLANVDRDSRVPVEIVLTETVHLEELDLDTGDVTPVSQSVAEGGPGAAAPSNGATTGAASTRSGHTIHTAVRTVFEPGQAHLYRIVRGASAGATAVAGDTAGKDQPRPELWSAPAAAPHGETKPVALERWDLAFEDDNILPIDTATLRVDGRVVARDAPLHLLWDRHFLALEDGTPFEVEYEFYLETAPAGELGLIVERLSSLEGAWVNGQSVQASAATRAWNDPAFERVNIGGIAREGWNTVRLAGRKFNNITSAARGVGFHRRVEPELAASYRPTELEAVYVTGAFRVANRHNREFWIQGSMDRPDATSEAALPVDLTAHGYPFYAGVFTLTTEVALEEPDAGGGGRRIDARPSAHGSYLELDGVTVPAVEVLVDGTKIGTLLWEPWCIPLPASVMDGARHELTLRMPTDLFNLMGPNWKTSGLPTMTGPDAFRRSEPWTAERSFLPRGIGAARVVVSPKSSGAAW